LNPLALDTASNILNQVMVDSHNQGQVTTISPLQSNKIIRGEYNSATLQKSSKVYTERSLER
jgi:hypothetical protein